MYLIHFISADKSSKWKAFWHWSSDLTTFVDQTKWMMANLYSILHQGIPVREENCLRETTYKTDILQKKS